jgi:hypothetical protein
MNRPERTTTSRGPGPATPGRTAGTGSLRRLKWLMIALILGTVPAAAGRAFAATTAPTLGATAQLPVLGRVIDAGPPTPWLAGPSAPTHPADDRATAARRAIADFVAGAFVSPSGDGVGDLGRAIPLGEVQLAIQAMPAADVLRIYNALPIVQHWGAIQKQMATGAAPFALPPPRGTRTFAPSDAAELEQVRHDLDAVFTVQQGWGAIVGTSDPAYVARIADGRKLLRDAQLEDLANLRDALAWIPDWQHTLAPDLNTLLGLGPGGTLMHRPVEPQRAMGAQPETTDEQCSTVDRERDPLPLIIASAVLRGTALIEDFAANFFTKDIKVCTGALGVTVCVDVPNPVFFILKTIQLATNRVVDGLDAAWGTLGVCQSIDHWKLTVAHRTEFLVNAQGIMASIIARNNELVGRTETIDLANREAWKLELELAIEDNLLLPAPMPDGSNENRISLFQLTDSVCFNPDELLPTPVPALPTPALTAPQPTAAPPPDLDPLPTVRAPVPVTDRREQCGLELVKRLVGEAIQLNLQAGNDIHDAQTIYAAANLDLAAHHFAQAYLRYRQAYRAAVQPDAEPRFAASTSADR